MAMATMNISLPDAMKAFVEEQVATGMYANASDFMRHAVRQRMDSIDRLDALIQEGIDSGWSDLGFDEIIDQARERTRSAAA
jgi:antitoxin ParD1/3/4